jgi:membrane fusion protein (multidrug efflux system)
VEFIYQYTKDVIVVPQKLFFWSARKQIVYVVGKETKWNRIIETNGTSGLNYIVTNGLSSDDVVVVEGVSKLKMMRKLSSGSSKWKSKS